MASFLLRDYSIPPKRDYIGASGYYPYTPPAQRLHQAPRGPGPGPKQGAQIGTNSPMQASGPQGAQKPRPPINPMKVPPSIPPPSQNEVQIRSSLPIWMCPESRGSRRPSRALEGNSGLSSAPAQSCILVYLGILLPKDLV